MAITIPYTPAPESTPQNIVQIPVADLQRRMGNLMQDQEHIRWTVEEAIDWFNDGAA